MIYAKVEIATGITLKVELDSDSLYTVCPVCKNEHQLDYEVLEFLEGDWSQKVSCGNEKCNEQMKGGVTS